MGINIKNAIQVRILNDNDSYFFLQIQFDKSFVEYCNNQIVILSFDGNFIFV